ncbi:MAG: Crp/Fnr family transcriptional regulator [Aquamicrobium sp.]|nr:Crp/Fnr family transcriptional regulator [Aquamicrobium sp.]
MPMLDRSVIAGLPPFEGLQPEDLDRVLEQARSARYPRDSVVFEQGTEATSFFLLLDGHVRVVRVTPEGEQIISRYINAGEMFGLAVAMARTTYPATAVAAVDCVVVAWPNSAWADLSRRFPSFGASTYRTIGKWLQDTHTRMLEMVTSQVEQRVAHALLRLAHQAGRKTPEGIEIDFPITRQDIAEMTATTLHTVSRLMSAWEEKGIVSSGRQKVTIVDPHGLMLIAEQRPRK